MAINKSHIRSISLPSRSHPTILQIQEQLNQIKTLESSATPTAEAISNGLCGLVKLYNSMDDLINMPQTLQAFSKYQNAKWVDELLECPVKLLDVCGILRDVVSQIKENVRDLEISLRRRKGDLRIEVSITKYMSLRNRLTKEAKKCISILKKMNQAIETPILDVDQQVSSFIKVVKEVNAWSISIFHYVFVFFSTSKSKSSKWSISKLLVNKGRVACEQGQQVTKNELTVIDDELYTDCSTVQLKLEQFEASIEGIENGLEGMSRCLIRSRTSLLNFVSC